MNKQIKILSNPYVCALLIKQYIPECKDFRIIDIAHHIHHTKSDIFYDKELFPLRMDIEFHFDYKNIHRLVYIKVCDTYRFEKQVTLVKEEGVAMQMYTVHERIPVYGFWIFTNPPIHEKGLVYYRYQYLIQGEERIYDAALVHIPMTDSWEKDNALQTLSYIFYEHMDEESVQNMIEQNNFTPRWN